MSKKKKVAAVAVAAILTCGTLAGCDALTTTNVSKDYAQIIADVDITKSDDFAESGKFAAYKDVVTVSHITKREMVASYVSSGYSLQQSYGWSYAEVFNTIAESLVSRQVFVQYAKVDLVANGDVDNNKYTVEGYLAKRAEAPEGASEFQREALGLSHFLTEEEKDKADYDLKVAINGSIDSIEKGFIEAKEEEHNHTADSAVRTLPTGAEKESSDYYTTDYAIYTGREDLSVLGEYERVEGSTPTTRRKAYTRFLSNLRQNDLLQKGENTGDFQSLTYYWMEVKSAYETALINKITDKFEKEAEDSLTETWSNAQFADDLQAHTDSYTRDKSTFESALDGISDTSFVLAPYDSNYGFVLNILLPFSDLQSQQLNEVSNDFGDAKGNKFAARAQLLGAIRATDQRGTWFTGHNDYSFEAGEGAYTAGDENRSWLFFENSFAETDEENAKYERLKNYYGKYTFNGTVEKEEDADGDTEYTITPNKISIDGFLTEMKNYLESAGVGVTTEDKYTEAFKQNYFTNTNFYKENGDVDYDSFIYEVGKISYFENEYYDANQIFLEGSKENIAYSVINELMFAYNTDTAGLNSYLGYSVSPYKTSYMTEFEHAAQIAVAGGAGTYTVVPTDYGWHIIYCTFSFADAAKAGKNAFQFKYEDRETEGTFSYNYFESLKATAVSTFANNLQSDLIDAYVDAGSKIYEDRFADLTGLDNK